MHFPVVLKQYLSINQRIHKLKTTQILTVTVDSIEVCPLENRSSRVLDLIFKRIRSDLLKCRTKEKNYAMQSRFHHQVLSHLFSGKLSFFFFVIFVFFWSRNGSSHNCYSSFFSFVQNETALLILSSFVFCLPIHVLFLIPYSPYSPPTFPPSSFAVKTSFHLFLSVFFFSLIVTMSH